ncbi:MAG: hypothetical protein LBS70_09595 [Candidatus Accumulibacter sp.]|jgi:hypothetical protein|nr:hypothetical protein [Accumulibacter sp.]
MSFFFMMPPCLELKTTALEKHESKQRKHLATANSFIAGRRRAPGAASARPAMKETEPD